MGTYADLSSIFHIPLSLIYSSYLNFHFLFQGFMIIMME